MDLETIAEILGHADIGTSLSYRHIQPDEVRAVMVDLASKNRSNSVPSPKMDSSGHESKEKSPV